MSMRAMIWAWSVSATPTQKLVLLKLADNANDDGLCWPSKRHMSEHTGLSHSAIKDAIRRLEDAGHLRIERREGEGGVNLPNRYHLAIPAEIPVDRVRGRQETPRGAAADRGVGRQEPHPGAPETPEPIIEPSNRTIHGSSTPDGADADLFPTKRYRWEGRIIRLNERDFVRWEASFKYLALEAHLESLDAFLASPEATPHQRKGWFHFVAGALKNRNEEAKAKHEAAGRLRLVTPTGSNRAASSTSYDEMMDEDAKHYFAQKARHQAATQGTH